MLFTVNRSDLVAALKSVIPFASKDETRFHLCGLALDNSLSGLISFIATDGHTLACATLFAPKSKTEHDKLPILSLEDCKSLLVLLKSQAKLPDPQVTFEQTGMKLAVTSGPNQLSYTLIDSTYPDYKVVVPPQRKEGEATPSIGCNPSYLARVGTACNDFAIKRSSVRGLVVTTPVSELDPIRFDYSVPDRGDLTLVVMPMRI